MLGGQRPASDSRQTYARGGIIFPKIPGRGLRIQIGIVTPTSKPIIWAISFGPGPSDSPLRISWRKKEIPKPLNFRFSC